MDAFYPNGVLGIIAGKVAGPQLSLYVRRPTTLCVHKA